MLPVTPLLAQDKFANSIKLYADAFYVPQRHSYFNIVNQVGISYERKITSAISAGIAYNQWNIFFDLPTAVAVKDPNVYNQYNMGDMMYRYEHKMIDLYGNYNLHITKHNMVNMGIGATYCRTVNSYVTRIQPGFHEAWWYFAEKRPAYYGGALLQAGYNYLLFKNRINIGADFRYRKLFGTPYTQLDYGVHLGVNF